MIRFDYLRSAPRAKLSESIPRRWQLPAALALAGCVVLAGTWWIQDKALRKALETERVYQTALDASQTQVARARARYRSISALLRLRSQARTISLSAGAQARVFFSIAQAMPDHVWITSVTRDGAGLLIAGGARSFDGVAQMIAGMSQVRALKEPALASASAGEERKTQAVSYQLHVDLVSENPA